MRKREQLGFFARRGLRGYGPMDRSKPAMSGKVFGGRVYRYKLDTGASEYILEMSGRLEEMAQKVEFEEVTVKGLFDLGNRLFEAEKISVK